MAGSKRVLTCSRVSDASEYKVLRKHSITPNAEGAILWHVVNFSPDMPKHKILLAFTLAFEAWQQKLDALPPVGRILSFRSTDNYDAAHIRIMFLDPKKRDHKITREDGVVMKFKHRWPFDANGGVLAHVPFDITDIYLDEGEHWGDMFKWDGPTLYAPLMEVVMHEIGHCLDLDHTKDPLDIMFAAMDGKTRLITQDSCLGLAEAGWAAKKEAFKHLLPPAACETDNATAAPSFTVLKYQDKLPKGKTPYNNRNLRSISQIVVHNSDDNGTPESIARWHVTGNGWPGIGYTFVIAKDGTIYQVNDLDTLCFNVAKQNTKSLGICLIGKYETETPPAIQVEALKWLIKLLKNVINADKVLGHNDTGVPTLCPGKNLEALIPTLNA